MIYICPVHGKIQDQDTEIVQLEGLNKDLNGGIIVRETVHKNCGEICQPTRND